MTFALVLLILAVTAVLWTARLLADGGHGCAPRSHHLDRRFGPPPAGVR